MSFSKTRFDKKYEYELTRFATKCGYQVVGGASKLFKRFVLDYNPASVVSYADLRYSVGNVYEKLNFNLKHKTKPGYYWFKNGIIYNRQMFQKKNLKKFANYDIMKTEKQMMFENGYRLLKNCGNLVYVWSRV
jgi:hypothetical protein